MNHKSTLLTGLLATVGIFGAWSLVASGGMIQKCGAILQLCANIKGMEYIVVVAFLGLLPAFFKTVDDDTHNRRAMKL
ncbi:MAG: hypothetical protein COZ12_06085 [Deltaproteobacteria bacterium CG_4_10_14_3_um_filter_60_8]|nr:MAG: hypothetical protein COX17_08605 [Deltaproteobacteria bacterium CG23_combo_of_CG06-09_8_20_14_all_60_8]PIY21185.1 MAG: hypothetical protein COZ12_06085 [Deltaproteobacteria bacterium CG_4_10_14_3_um_filter_60_8]